MATLFCVFLLFLPMLIDDFEGDYFYFLKRFHFDFFELSHVHIPSDFNVPASIKRKSYEIIYFHCEIFRVENYRKTSISE